jgi:parallel beta-helix repeat protein
MLQKRRNRFLKFSSLSLLLCIFSLNFYFGGFLNDANNTSCTGNESFNDINLKSLGYWTLNNITIDDSLTGIGAKNWTWAANQPWCSGNGIWNDPYLIENVTINPLNKNSGIKILNSDKYFILRNNTVYNASAGAYEGGISLYFVDNGRINENNCSFNNGLGILLEYSNNNTIFGNIVINNSEGISLKDSNNNKIQNNTVSNNINAGINVQNCENNNLSDNIANYNPWVGIYLNSCNDHIIDNNTANYNYYAGFRIDSSENNTISENTFNHNLEHGIMLWGNNENNRLIDNVMKFNLKYGLQIWQSSNNTIKGNAIKNNTQHGIDLIESNYNIIKENTVNNNTLMGIRLCISSNNNTIKENNVTNNLWDGIYLEDSDNNTVVRNIATNNAGDGIYLSGGSNNNSVKKNSLSLNNQGIHLYGNINNTVIGNTIYNHTWHGIHVEYSNNCIITKNNVYNNLRSGIYLFQSNLSTISENIATYNGKLGGHDGILIRESINNTISQNTVQFNYDDGIGLNFNCTNNSILNNVITNNGWAGIILFSECNDNDLINNMITDNSWHGIYLSDSSDNDVIGNRIKDNIIYGVYILNLGCENNLFSYNFFIGNGRNAYDDGWYNYWNSSTIGNYWDNYTGIDTNDDGIGDTPFCLHPEWLPGWAINDSLPIYDVSVPVIDINSPDTDDVFGATAPSFVVVITDHYLDLMWYTLDGGLPYTFTENDTIDQPAWSALPDGDVTITFYASDLLGMIGSTEIVISKDTQAPIINISSPNDGEVFGNNAPYIWVEYYDPNLDTVGYSFEGVSITVPGPIIGIIGPINQTIWSALPEGNYIITFFANDTVGNEAFEEVSIIKDLPQPVIHGYNIFVFLGFIIIITAAIALTLFKERNKLKI